MVIQEVGGFFNFWQCLGLGGRVDWRLYERGRAEATPIMKIPFVRFVSSFFFLEMARTRVYFRFVEKSLARAKRLFS